VGLSGPAKIRDAGEERQDGGNTFWVQRWYVSSQTSVGDPVGTEPRMNGTTDCVTVAGINA